MTRCEEPKILLQQRQRAAAIALLFLAQHSRLFYGRVLGSVI